MNPRAGEGSPSADELVAVARQRGAEARKLGREDNAAELAREAAERGASALGMAGGDGSLAPVAAVALEADLPFVPVPFGTRNHFARDVGFDVDDPLGALEAFAGDERTVDVGALNGRVFLNNVSIGLYASLVHDSRYETKNRLVALVRMLPAAFGRSRRPLDLSFEREGRAEHRSALMCLVANNDYSLKGTRQRLDEGILHAYVIEAAARRTLLALLARAAAGRLEGAEGWAEWPARSLRVEAKRPRIHAALDGEPLVLKPPLEFEVRPRALRILVPTRLRDGEAPSPPRN